MVLREDFTLNISSIGQAQIFERELARLAAVHVAGLEEKGGGDCFQKVWQDFARRSIKEVLHGPLSRACVPWPGG